MFAGHYAAAIAVKAAEPRAPFWALVAGCQLVDIAWAGLMIAGVERAQVDPTLPGSALVLEHMPWTHSLPAAFVWSLAALLAARFLLRLGWPVAVAIAASVFSHWLLDLIVHRPDLELYPGGPKAGFGLWNHEVIEQAVEIGLIAVAGVFWAALRVRQGRSAWPAAAFIALLVAVQIAAMLTPLTDNNAETGASALAVYLVLIAIAAFVDRASPRPHEAAV